MKKEQLAAQLNGREYGNEITTEEENIAHLNELVVVFGYSDDCTEFRGIMYEELGAGEIEFTKGCVFKSEDDDEVLEKYGNPVTFNTIEAIWNPRDSQGNIYASWAYKTEIPHVTFDIIEEGELYCRGIVFSINDLK